MLEKERARVRKMCEHFIFFSLAGHISRVAGCFCSALACQTERQEITWNFSLSVNEWSGVNGLSAIYMLPERYIASGALIVLNGIFPFPESIRHLNFIWKKPLNIQSLGALSDQSNKISL